MREIDAYMNLSLAIVERAFLDLRKAKMRLKKKPDDKDALEMKKDVEDFFEGEFFDLIAEFNLDLRNKAEMEVRQND